MFIYQILPRYGGIFLPLQAWFSFDSNCLNWPCVVIFLLQFIGLSLNIMANLTNSSHIFNCFSDSVHLYGKIRHINLNLDRFDDLYCLILSRTLFTDFNKSITHMCTLLPKNQNQFMFFFYLNRLYKETKYRENKQNKANR